MAIVFSETSTEAVVDNNEEHVYEIEEIIESASAFVCIAHAKEDREQKLAFKILREYKDERYHYGSAEERLACQKEALRKNLEITPNVYQGLMQISRAILQELEQKKPLKELQGIILAPSACESSQIEQIGEQTCEYALAMSYLSYKQRLDILLNEKGFKKQKELFLHCLATRIEQMHRQFRVLTTETNESGNIWGSYEQLLNKLEHNLMHFDFIERYDLTLYGQYSTLKADIQYFIKQQVLVDAFNKRRCGFVRHCHGDLKMKNIWIETINYGDTPLEYVRILDAVDFNESYRNIDVLADLAMLVVDVEAIEDENLGKYLGKYLKEEYLSLSKQTDDAAKLVLAYYLLEKAIVCAIVCIVYDHCEPHMGQRFLDLAKKHANELRGLMNSPTKENFASNAA